MTATRVGSPRGIYGPRIGGGPRRSRLAWLPRCSLYTGRFSAPRNVMPSESLIKHSRPSIGEEEIAAVLAVMREGRLATGWRVKALEDWLPGQRGRGGAGAPHY